MNVQFPRFDLYRELGVGPTATADEIEAAWKKEVASARDAGPAAQRIQRLNTAHQWLANPERRGRYDRELARRRQAGNAAAATAAVRPQSRPGSARRQATRRSGGGIPLPWVAAGVVAAAILAVIVVFRPFGAAPAGPGGPGGSATPSGSVVAAVPCPTSQPPALPEGETRTVTIETPKGTMTLKIEADLSPIAAGNFVALAACDFYDGVVFHRTPTLGGGAAFVIQGGDPEGTGSGGPGYSIKDEPVTAEYHRGTVAMARTPQPDSVGSQFFIVLSEEAQGPLVQANTYQIIGTVSSGIEVADAIHAASAGQELPTNPVAMTNVTVSNP